MLYCWIFIKYVLLLKDFGILCHFWWLYMFLLEYQYALSWIILFEVGCLFLSISGHKWSTTHRVLKSQRSQMSIMYMLSWKQCVPSWLSLQWLCGNSCTWAHDICIVWTMSTGRKVSKKSAFPTREFCECKQVYKMMEIWRQVFSVTWFDRSVLFLNRHQKWRKMNRKCSWQESLTLFSYWFNFLGVSISSFWI